MNEKIIELLTILDDEAACYRDMQRVLADEEASVSLVDKVHFDRVRTQKETLVGKLQQFEVIRKGLVEQLAKAYRVNDPMVTVSQLSRVLPAPYREKLISRATQLRSLITEVRLSNQHNQQLIHQNLDLIRGSLELLTHLIYDNSVYLKPGSANPALGYSSSGGRFFCETA
jgi:flagellar biosynthesis/type III secretory pathway chaperone